MTYCVGLLLNRGLVFMSDTRTNSGIDNVSVFRKMTTWRQPGERLITMLTAGNLATTQAVVSQLDERWKTPAERMPSLLEAPTMYQAARLVGETLRGAINQNAMSGQAASSVFNATIILGGQIRGMPPRLREVFVLSRFVHLEYQEISERLGIPVTTVQWRMTKALEYCTAQLRL